MRLSQAPSYHRYTPLHRKSAILVTVADPATRQTARTAGFMRRHLVPDSV